MEVFLEDGAELFAIADHLGFIFERISHPSNGTLDGWRGISTGEFEVDPPSILAAIDEPCFVEDVEVLGDGRWSEAEEFYELAETKLAAAEGQERPEAGLIVEGFCDC